MPVNPDDELRGAEKMLERWEQGYELHKDELVATVEGLYQALRAALAARPQPDTGELAAALAEYDRLHDAFMNDPAEDVETAVRLTAPLPAAKDAVIAAARAAVAGSATPTVLPVDMKALARDAVAEAQPRYGPGPGIDPGGVGDTHRRGER